MEEWTKAGLILLIVGLAITLPSAYLIRTVIADHETLTLSDLYLEMGPHDPGSYHWSVWIEDFHDGPATQSMFEVYASDNPPDVQLIGAYPTVYTTHEFDGVTFVQMHYWESTSLDENEIYFCVELDEEELAGSSDTVEVNLVRTGGLFHWVSFAAGLALFVAGSMILLRIWWNR
jgi:hypothetical protein